MNLYTPVDLDALTAEIDKEVHEPLITTPTTEIPTPSASVSANPDEKHRQMGTVLTRAIEKEDRRAGES